MPSQFNSDTEALIQRARLNQSATHDLEDWIFQQVRIASGMSILDLGCGTGKQIYAIHNKFPETKEIVGVDISPQAVRSVAEKADHHNIKNISAIDCSLDNILGTMSGRKFNLILSTYAIYYASDQVALIKGLRALLTPGGELFISGFAQGSNKEINSIIARARQYSQEKIEIDDFIDAKSIARAAAEYSSFEISRLNNCVQFDSADDVICWWENHNS
ncbi:MAG: class I SAM-dependent methyltransferase, partial [Betaproteobacteria bacterium]|nr:class I SAM-dependent methyltransferase [Betaproteobacteria bacterium]